MGLLPVNHAMNHMVYYPSYLDFVGNKPLIIHSDFDRFSEYNLLVKCPKNRSTYDLSFPYGIQCRDKPRQQVESFYPG